MTVLRRKELLKIVYAVAKTMTPEEINLLKKNVPAIWETFTHLAGPDAYTEWEIHNLNNVFDISYRIQEMMDAKVGKCLKEVPTFGDGLPKIYLVEVAKLFGIVSKEIESHAVNMSKWQLVNAILEKC